MKQLKTAVALLTLCSSMMAFASDPYVTGSNNQLYQGEGLVIKNAYIKNCKHNPGSAKVYMTIENRSENVDYTFIGGYSPAADTTMLYAPKDGTMHPVNTVMLEPGSEVKLRPGNIHLRMTDLNQDLQKGSKVPVCLKFEMVAPALCVDVPVK